MTDTITSITVRQNTLTRLHQVKEDIQEKLGIRRISLDDAIRQLIGRYEIDEGDN